MTKEELEAYIEQLEPQGLDPRVAFGREDRQVRNERLEENTAVAVLLAAMAVLVFMVAYVALIGWAPPVPHCQEDQIIVGAGDFENGLWDHYHCADGDPEWEGGTT